MRMSEWTCHCDRWPSSACTSASEIVNTFINNEHWHYKANILLCCLPPCYNPTPDVTPLWDCAGFKRPLWLQECCKIFPGGTYKWNKLLWRVVLLMEEYKTLKDPCFFALSNKNYLNACGCTAGWEFWIKACSDAWTSLWRITECNQRQQECIFLKHKNDHCWDNVTEQKLGMNQQRL